MTFRKKHKPMNAESGGMIASIFSTIIRWSHIRLGIVPCVIGV